MSDAKKFELTYGTMFNPPQELHDLYEKAAEEISTDFGKEYGMWINGAEKFSEQKFENRSPVDTNLVLGVFQKGTEKHAQEALQAARKAFPDWNELGWEKRVAYVRRAAELIDERLFRISAFTSYEVGKNRMEALADVAEAAALMRYACEQIEANQGFILQMGEDPIPGYRFQNISELKPYGVWLVISPFNFPGALSYGPVGAALAAGNTVILKPASDTPLVPRLIAECFRDAGFPEGVFNYVTGPGSTLGNALVESDEVDGLTFTGSYEVGMGIYRSFAGGKWVRPVILELGGKNPVIVSRNADLETAATGIVRSAFGLQGQKCSANSRIFVEEQVYQPLLDKLVDMTEKLKVGNPTSRDVFMGPVINKFAFQSYYDYINELSKTSEIVCGGKAINRGELAKGYYVAPALVTDLPLDHELWKTEMFLPISTIAPVKTLEEGMRLANNVDYGLTAGFYGTPDESDWFFKHIQAGVVYANRPQGSTTGAWPGFQPFGGWKGSGASGKNGGGPYYVQLYMHEQSRTLVSPF